MRTIWGTAIAFLMLCSAAVASAAHYNPTQADRPNMRTFGTTSMPYGYYDYCQRYKDRCARRAGGTMVELTRSAWSNIVRINAEVNSIPALTDMEIYGVVRRQGFWDNRRFELTEALVHQGYHFMLPPLGEASGVV